MFSVLDCLLLQLQLARARFMVWLSVLSWWFYWLGVQHTGAIDIVVVVDITALPKVQMMIGWVGGFCIEPKKEPDKM